MSDIQRLTVADPARMSVVPAQEGDLVTYADHMESLRQARADERLEQIGGGEAWQIGFEDGRESALVDERKRSVLLIADAYGKGLDAARDAVANLPVAISAIRDAGPLNTQGMRPCEEPDDYPHGLVQVAAMAAIDALRGAK